MVRFMGYARKREPKWPYVAMAFIILMVAAVVLFIFSAVTQWLESEAKKPVTTTTTTVSTTSSTTTLAPATTTTTTSLAPAKKTEIVVPAASAATGIKIERIAIASGVEANQPVDDLAKVSVNETSKLYCYINMSNAGNSQTIRHVWIGPGGKVAAEIELTARGGTSTTWSYINISGLGTGLWQVRVETKDGTVLAKKTLVTY